MFFYLLYTGHKSGDMIHKELAKMMPELADLVSN